MIRSIPRLLSRRTLLRGGLGVGVALPLLEAMMPRTVVAQTAVLPKRFGVFFSPCGTIPENWQCTANGSNFTLSPILQPLAPYQSDLVVIRGVNMESTQAKYGPIANVHDQGMTHMLTAIGLVKGPAGAGRANHFLDGSAGGPSIDQHIAAAIGDSTPLRSLELGVETSSTFLEVLVTRMCYGAVQAGDTYKRALPVPAVDDPVQIYTRLFGTAAMGTADQMVQALKNRKSVLDYALADYNTLMARVGTEDRAKLDQHAANLRDIETQLTKLLAGTGPSCPGKASITPISPARVQCLRDQDLRTAAEKALPTNTTNQCVTNFPEIGKLQMDLMVLALQCDITRVASMQWSTAESTAIHTWLPTPLEYTGTKEHHMMTHNESLAATALGSMVDQATSTIIRRDLTKIHTWYSTQFAYLIGKMKGIQEGSGTLLDNSLMFWTNELGVGGTHEYTNVPYVLAGKAGGQLKTGRYLDFLGTQTPAFGSGPPHNQLFVSFMQLFGMPDTKFGLQDFSGPLSGLV
jgi:Protein of unknown function (DUF1552)